VIMHNAVRFLVVLLGATTCGYARADVNSVQAYEAARDGRARLIDIRTPQEWRETGVPARAARADFHRGPDALVRAVSDIVGGDRNAPIVLICRTGNRSAQAKKILEMRGYTRVEHVKEGMAGSGGEPGWLARGLPVEPCRC